MRKGNFQATPMTRRPWPICTSIAIAIDLGFVLASGGMSFLQDHRCFGGRWFPSLCTPTSQVVWLLVLASAPVALVFSIIGLLRRSRPPFGGSQVPVLVFSISLLAAAWSLLVLVTMVGLALGSRS